MAPPTPPIVGTEFYTFEEAKDYYQEYAIFNGGLHTHRSPSKAQEWGLQ